jgi:hypothetical protein
LAWTEITRPIYRREGQRYASDLTDTEWSLVEPLLPEPCRLGRPRTVDFRAVLDGLLYILASGCQWRALPRDFPPRSTVQGYFYRKRCFQATSSRPTGAPKAQGIRSSSWLLRWPVMILVIVSLR